MNQIITLGSRVRIIPNDENFTYVGRHYQARSEFVVTHIVDEIVYTTDDPVTEPGIGIWRLEKSAIVPMNTRRLNNTNGPL